MAVKINSIGNKLQLTFIPGLLVLAIIILWNMLGLVRDLYDRTFTARLSTELNSAQYVMDVFEDNLKAAALRTAEFRGVVDTFKDQDHGGIAQALKERISTEEVDFAFALRIKDGNFEVVARGHNTRIRYGASKVEDGAILNLWSIIRDKNANGGIEFTAGTPSHYGHVDRATLVHELGGILPESKRQELVDDFVLFVSSPVKLFGDNIGYIILGKRLRDNQLLKERILPLLGNSKERERDGFVLVHDKLPILNVGRKINEVILAKLTGPRESSWVGQVKYSKSESIDGVFSPLPRSQETFIGVISDKSDLVDALRSVSLSSMTIVGVLTAAFAFLSILSVRFLLRPVGALVQAATSMTEGNYSTRVKITSHDEIGSLAASFNSMAESIELNMLKIQEQHDILRDKNQSILLVNQVIQEFANLSDPAATLEHIGKRTSDLAHADWFVIARANSENGFDWAFASSNAEESIQPILRAGQLNRLPPHIRIFDISNEETWTRKQPLEFLRSPDKLLLSKKEGQFDEDQLELVEVTTRAGGIAIANQGKIALKAEMETARAVQSALFPSAELNLPYCRTASHYFSPGQVGGDWFGYVEDEDSCSIFMADATGHGASAALITAVARAAVSSTKSLQQLLTERQTGSSAKPAGLTTAEYMRHLNTLVGESGRDQILMTCVCVRVGPNEHSLEVCSAAHPPALLFNPNTKSVMRLNAIGFRLGWRVDSTFEVKLYPYEPGDLLILYTDGLIEAYNSDYLQYGLKRLVDTIIASPVVDQQGLQDHILADVNSYTRNTPQADDITLVVAALA